MQSRYEADTGKFVGTRQSTLCCLANDNRYSARREANDPHTGISLFLEEGKEPVVTVGIDLVVTSVRAAFDPAGTHFAWGNEDGTVTVCDIPRLQRRLAEVRLGW